MHRRREGPRLNTCEYRLTFLNSSLHVLRVDLRIPGSFGFNSTKNEGADKLCP